MPNQLCYIGSVREDHSGFPTVTFHFANRAQLVLDTQSIFLHIAPRVFCLAIGSSAINGDNSKNLSVIGMMAQQNYNVGYDMVKTSCTSKELIVSFLRTRAWIEIRISFSFLFSSQHTRLTVFNDRIFVMTTVTLLSTSGQTKQNGHHECSVL